MYQLIPNLTFAHSSCPWGRVFANLSVPGVCPGVCPRGGLLNQSKSSTILKENSATFAFSLKQMSSSSFHMFIYARSELPTYTITNTQRIRIYPGKLKLILVKYSLDPGRLHGKHAKENQTLLTFLTTENLSGLPCSHECKHGAFSDLSTYAVHLPG